MSCPTSRTSCRRGAAPRRASPPSRRSCRPWTPHLARYHDARPARPGRAATSGADLFGAPKKATKTKVGDLANGLAIELIEPLRDRIENCFREAAGDDEELAERLRACYREWKGQRVDEAVTRSGLAACNRGLLDSLQAGTKVHWIVDDGENPSPDCDDNALAGDLPGRDVPHRARDPAHLGALPVPGGPPSGVIRAKSRSAAQSCPAVVS